MSVIQLYSRVKEKYIYSCMNTPVFQQQFAFQSNGSTRQSVGIQDLRELILNMSLNIKEQERIGNFFFILDRLINPSSATVGKAEKYQKIYA